MARNRVGSCLRVDEKHPEFARFKASEVDDSRTALLAHARARPPHLSTSAASAYHGACFGLASQPSEELDAFVLGPNLCGVGNECGGFDDREHAVVYVRDVGSSKPNALRPCFGGLTFDMRGGRKWAKPACGRPLDGRVRPHWASVGEGVTCDLRVVAGEQTK